MPIITKSDISVFCTNLVAIVLSIFFIRTYVAQGISLGPLGAVIILCAIILSISLVIKPCLLPKRRLLMINLSISVIAGLLFFKDIKLFGFVLVIFISILLSIIENILHGAMK